MPAMFNIGFSYIEFKHFHSSSILPFIVNLFVFFFIFLLSSFWYFFFYSHFISFHIIPFMCFILFLLPFETFRIFEATIRNGCKWFDVSFQFSRCSTVFPRKIKRIRSSNQNNKIIAMASLSTCFL